jgi:hypothetical protein
MFSEDYYEHLEGFRVLEKDGKYYLKFKPDILYETKKEAEERAKEYNDCLIFF